MFFLSPPKTNNALINVLFHNYQNKISSQIFARSIKPSDAILERRPANSNDCSLILSEFNSVFSGIKPKELKTSPEDS
jgi:hypothetical protein